MPRLLTTSSMAALFLPQMSTLTENNRVIQYIHWKICNHYDTKTSDKWYEHKPLPVTDTSKVAILWYLPIRTDITIQANRPDIVIVKHKQNKMFQLIDTTCHQIAIFLLKSLQNFGNIKILKLKLLRCGKWKWKPYQLL